MDTNYSRWIHNDVDADVDAPDEEQRRFRFPRPAGSVVARGLMATLVLAGLGGILYSVQMSETSSTQQSPIETTTTDERDEPGAAAIEDSTVDESPTEESTDKDGADDVTEFADASTDAPEFVPPRAMRWHRIEARNGLPPRARFAIRRAREAMPPGERLDGRPFPGPPQERLDWQSE